MPKPLFLPVILFFGTALAAGTPVPRAISVGEDACTAMCSGAKRTPSCPGTRGCAPCPASSAACRTAKDAAPSDDAPPACRLCVCSQCGIATMAAAVRIEPPAGDAAGSAAAIDRLRSIDRRPASPPPKRLV